MSFRTYEHCFMCKDKIREDEPVVELKMGRARSKGFFRNLFGLINLRRPASISHVHVECLKETNYNYKNPTKTMTSLENSIKIGENIE